MAVPVSFLVPIGCLLFFIGDEPYAALGQTHAQGEMFFLCSSTAWVHEGICVPLRGEKDGGTCYSVGDTQVSELKFRSRLHGVRPENRCVGFAPDGDGGNVYKKGGGWKFALRIVHKDLGKLLLLLLTTT